MKKALRSIWQEIITPSTVNEAPYMILLIAIGHVMLGAALTVIDVAGLVAIGRVAIPAVYWLTKERGDLRRGGSVLDGLLDAYFVALGATYHGPIWWPIVALVSALAGVILLTAWRSK